MARTIALRSPAMKNAFREHLRLSGIEIKRIIGRNQILLIGVVILWLVWHDLFSFSPLGDPPGLFGIGATAEHDAIFNCLVAAAGGAAAFAGDTETGFLGLTLSRTIPRRHHILHKITAMWAVIATITFTRFLLLYIVGAFVLPWDVPALTHYCEVGKYGLCWPAPPFVLPNEIKDAPGPFPALFLTHPVLNDLVGMIMVCAGTGVIALLGFFAAACGANTFVAMAMPVIVAFTYRIVLEDIVPVWANPTSIVHVFEKSHGFKPGMEYQFGLWIVRLLVWTGVLTGLTIYIAEKRELAAKGGDQ